ncbi:hypothetical protein [Alkalihalophilus marmarensis]|uniref:Uncharacterized protein n=1 Tax=Alkalihalophilus marmarensis DSM 21297 TaxID=1188261 RepID=U6SRG2_9BACI|nr:hypothetical protein [Alkalihalophilus marmarensis]ERN54304.1 hypothetical protein A33I_07710 [Alkalihalophilus marmarensis DSM 21297]
MENNQIINKEAPTEYGTNTSDWKLIIATRIKKIKDINTALGKIMKELKIDENLETAVRENHKDSQVSWIISIDNIEMTLKYSDFDFDLKHIVKQIDADRFGRPINEMRQATLKEVIEKALLEKFNQILK